MRKKDFLNKYYINPKTGDNFMLNIKTIIKRILPESLKYNAFYYFGEDYSSQINFDNRPKVFILLAGDYGNLGDIAITEAQKDFIQNNMPGYNLITVELNRTLSMLKTIKKNIKPDDVITIIGGGNMGERYEGFEILRRNIIRSFSNNRIVSFPQTIDFSKTSYGEKSFKKTIKTYNSHPNLHIFARESISFEIMKKAFKNNHVQLTPDIVLSLKKESKNEVEREGIIFCLRDDSEKHISSNLKDAMIEKITQKFTSVSYYDTHMGIDASDQDSLSEEFDNILDAFSKSKLIITDRLHGMIFCVITGTPCIVLPNSNHKIVGTYNDWLNNLDHINLITKTTDINLLLRKVDLMMNINSKEINIPNFNEYYTFLKKSLKL